MVGDRIQVILAVTCFIQSLNAEATVLTTWPYPEATDKAFETLVNGGSHIDALVDGCDLCDLNPGLCRNSVGPGRPNEEGETTLDALVMDGITHGAGAVGCLKRIQEATKVARAVMDHTSHTLLVGEDATEFALRMGFTKTSLETEDSVKRHREWYEGGCQPNHWKNVTPDPEQNCGPYSPETNTSNWMKTPPTHFFSSSEDEHDTIGMVVLDGEQRVAAGTSTNGLAFKIPGRVGDSPIPGSGAYADGDVGGAAATGNGDVMMRFMPSFAAVLAMRDGASPTEACEAALVPIATKYPSFGGAVIAMNKNGEYGAACYGYDDFIYTVREEGDDSAKFIAIECITVE